MENMEEKIMDVLSDPQKMEGIMNIVKNLGFSPPSESTEEQTPEPDPQMTGTILNLLQKANAPDGRQDALLHALMPYLRPSRQKKLQQALRVAKLSSLAGFALKNYSDQL